MSEETTASPSLSSADQTTARRQEIMAVMAETPASALAKAFESYPDHPSHELVRGPETGLVMVRGRMGGTGGAFNLGEVTVTRCVVRLATGETGSSYILGRHKQHALQAAILDGLWQNPDHRQKVEDDILAPLENSRRQRQEEIKAETAATKVDFFTMVRGDD
ncbi:phosphonate C-P lyase system protein PhnG [Roseibium polysiphoniae]|uniref:Phosphonate C-P lyase system protein PhnG n=1 Tax=Roseibium polysiphoniae TaxID=2571221 RepID=A0A944CHA1_9HYPH|nr:phosphonate C-P lyase system protein PhnG [Roseibium polysiphoniae]MBS8261903.1 phosphonate C-P lyase system protein PhnG [Roseibium polysiphoniae]